MFDHLNDLLKRPEGCTRTEIQAELEQVKGRFDKEIDFVSAINALEDENYPLHLALLHAPYPVVELLLSYDLRIRESTKSYLDSREDRADIIPLTSLINFYNFLQTQLGFEDDFLLGQTLSLIEESIQHLPKERSSEGVIFMGDTGAGKSTLCNALLGCRYEAEESQIYNGYTLKLASGSDPEAFESSNATVSVTSHPNIRPLPMLAPKKVSIVDMPGFDDTAGLPKRISIGLSAQALSGCFDAFCLMVVVIDFQKLKERAAKYNKIFNALAKILKNDPSLMRNVVVVLNNIHKRTTPSKSVLKTQLMKLKPTLEATSQFVLSELTDEQLIVVNGAPGETFKNDFLACAAQATPVLSTAFELKRYVKETDKFDKLLQALRDFYDASITEANAIRNHILNKNIADLSRTVSELAIINDHIEIEERVEGDGALNAGICLGNQRGIEIIEQKSKLILELSGVIASLEEKIDRGVVEGYYTGVNPDADHEIALGCCLLAEGYLEKIAVAIDAGASRTSAFGHGSLFGGTASPAATGYPVEHRPELAPVMAAAN